MFTFNCNGKILFFDSPIIMGIINVTPDSFHASSRKQSIDAIVEQAKTMLAQGATILDIGGQSTRPGAEIIAEEAELQRVLPAIEAIKKHFPEAILSIDTFRPNVAKASVAAGCSMVNDVSGGTFFENMLETVASLRVPYVCMHTQGTPADMQANPQYQNVVIDVLDYFIKRVEACKQAGIHDVMIDPGIGFGKTQKHNLELIKNLAAFKILERPILLGISRKNFIRKLLEVEVENALNGTTIFHTIGLQNGANILRVHDVKEAMEVVKVFEKINS